MNTACSTFRRSLSSLLTGAPRAEGLIQLGWHSHLLACEACRDLLAQEEALEQILQSLPEPKLPPGLVARVLKRLDEGRLEILLELDLEMETPPTLASSVLQGLRESEEQALDRLLERAGEVDIPATLASDVLERTAREARPTLTLVAPQVVGASQGSGRRVWMRVAAAVLLGIGCYRIWIANFGEQQEPSSRELVRGPDSAAEEGLGGEPRPSAPDPMELPSVEMLAMLDYLPYVQLGDGDAELEAYTQLEETSPMMWGFDATSAEVLNGWDGWDEPSTEEAR